MSRMGLVAAVRGGGRQAGQDAPGCVDCGVRLDGRGRAAERGLERREGATALCGLCRARRGRAEAILDRLPVFAASFGSRSHAEWRVGCALAACDALGEPDGLDPDRTAARLVAAAVRLLADAGASVRFDAVPRGNAASRWAHVGPERADALRAAYAQYRLVLDFVPHPVPPPTGENGLRAMRGCLLCGVSGALAQSADTEPWGRMHTAVAATLGGRGSPEPLHGYVCPQCRESMRRNGVEALGADALELALYDCLRERRGEPQEGRDRARVGALSVRSVQGLCAWCVSGRGPSAEPWDHLGGLGTLAGLA